MILFDFSPIVIGAFHESDVKKQEPTLELVRHITLNIIRSYTKRYKKQYGNVVLCMDSGDVWRKDYFEYYKAHRAKNRAESSIDWGKIFEYMDVIRQELYDNYPGYIVRVPKTEADDIIAVLAKYLAMEKGEEVMIISSDGDMSQLLKYDGVSQFSPILKKEIKQSYKDAFYGLITKVIKGDRGDGVPNVRSGDRSFVDNIRQKPISSSILEEAVENGLEETVMKHFGEEGVRNLHRNKTLVDLDCVPEKYTQEILEVFNNYKPKPRHKFMNYLVKNRLAQLTSSLEDF